MTESNNGISREAYSLGRSLDQLPPGEYVIQLSIKTPREGGWIADIAKSEAIRKLEVGSDTGNGTTS
jgi:hypothetical protein